MDFLATSRQIERRLAEGRARLEELGNERRRLALDAVLGDERARAELDRFDVALMSAQRAVRDLEDARPELERRRLEAVEQARKAGEAREAAQAASLRAVRRREAEKQIARLVQEGNHNDAERWREHVARHPDYAEPPRKAAEEQSA